MTTNNLRAVPNIADSTIDVTDKGVLLNNLIIANPDLVDYLKQFDTPQKQTLAFIDLVNLAMSVKGLSVGALETEVVKKTGEMVVQELVGTVATMNEKMNSSVISLIDPENGVIAQKLREVSAGLSTEHQDSLKGLLSLSDEASPIAQLNKTLSTALTTHVNGVKTEIAEVAKILNQYIGAQEKKKELHLKSREKGGDLEEILDEMIQAEAVVHGDDARYVGDTPSPAGKNVGDEIITINPDVTNGEEVIIVWEAKTDATFKDKKGRLKRDKIAVELNDAMENREGIVGIFVADAHGLDLNVQPIWQEFEGNKLAIVLDTEDPDQRLVRLAYLWARSHALRSLAPEEVEFDTEAIDRVINNLEREFKTLRNLKSAHTPIRENIKKAEDFVEAFEEHLDELLEELRSLISAEESE